MAGEGGGGKRVVRAPACSPTWKGKAEIHLFFFLYIYIFKKITWNKRPTAHLIDILEKKKKKKNLRFKGKVGMCAPLSLSLSLSWGGGGGGGGVRAEIFIHNDEGKSTCHCAAQFSLRLLTAETKECCWLQLV